MHHLNNRYLFLKEMPIGENEFKVILSSNMDTDIAYNDKVISDSIIIQFPEYNFAEARSRAYGLSIQCEFSDEGKINRDKLSKKGMKVSESSKYLQCRQDSQKLLKEFKKQTNTPYVLNTSLNLPGHTLVEDVHDLHKMFLESNLKYIWLPDIRKLVIKNGY